MAETIALRRLVGAAAALTLAWTLAPLLLLSFLGVSVFRRLYCRLLEWRYPGVEPDCSPSVRAATDTRRNQAIVTLLTHLRGKCDVEHIKKMILDDVLERRNGNGDLLFPRLRATLTSRWGHYAWIHQPSEFQLDNHVVQGSQLFRGRPLTDGNIQDYVSDIVSKCLPANLPPWQVVLIPVAATSSSEAPSFYALLRLHHLLVVECAALRDMLSGDWGWGQPLVPKPQALPYIFSQVASLVSGAWLQLREDKDPAVNNKALHRPLLDTLSAVLFFTVIDSCSAVFQSEPWYKLLQPSVWIKALTKQVEARNLSTKRIIGLTIKAFYPIALLAFTVRVISFVGFLTLQVPLQLLRQARDANARAVFFEAIQEVFFWIKVALDGPRIVLEEFFTGTLSPPPVHLSLCGRRVVAWSEPASVQLVERIATSAGCTPVEVLLAAASGALREHYRKQGCVAPAVPVQPFGATGVLLLPPPSGGDDCVTTLRVVQERIENSRKQPALLLASSWLRKYLTSLLPSLSVRLVLNCVTRRYATIIMTSAPDILRSGKANLWGYTVDSVLLWRPPQANISVSLSLVRLGDSIRLAVMADQQLWPHHAALPASFLAQLKEIAATLQVQGRSPTHSPPPRTSSIPALLRLEEESLVD